MSEEKPPQVYLRYCGFCGLSQNEVEVLVVGIHSNICNNCISEARLCVDSYREKKKTQTQKRETT